MTRGALSLGLLMAAALCGASRAADLKEFQALCVATHADSKAALAAADAAGWMPIPDALMAQLKRPGIEAAQGRLKTDAGAMRFMLAASQSSVAGPGSPKIDACVIGFVPPDASLADQVKAWAGVPETPGISKGAMHGYVFLDEHGRHRPALTPGQDPNAVLKTSEAAIVLVQEQPQLTLLIFGVPSTTSPN